MQALEVFTVAQVNDILERKGHVLVPVSRWHRRVFFTFYPHSYYSRKSTHIYEGVVSSAGQVRAATLTIRIIEWSHEYATELSINKQS